VENDHGGGQTSMAGEVAALGTTSQFSKHLQGQSLALSFLFCLSYSTFFSMLTINPGKSSLMIPQILTSTSIDPNPILIDFFF
jgi:hypothetical protein